MTLKGKNRSTKKKKLPLCPPPIKHRLPWEWTQASKLTGPQPNPWGYLKF